MKVAFDLNTHLSEQETIKSGSIYTPSKIVNLCFQMSNKFITKNTTIVDFGAGYGAFINKFKQTAAKKIIATDFDKFSIDFITKNFNGVIIKHENSLLNISREKYNLKKTDDLMIIGNPPYNDVTSQYRKGEKGENLMDKDVYSRDLGISFLKMYSKLNPQYICILHPLSYLIKKGNFNSAKDFFKKYKLINAYIFSSKEFGGIKKGSIEFPVVAALYKKDKNGITFEQIKEFKFKIFEQKIKACLKKYLTIDGIVDKYPSKNKADNDLQFYTIRDLNALIRNKTFLIGHCNNGIKVIQDKLHLYAWLDFVKKYFPKNDKTYIFGNLNPVFNNEIILNHSIKDSLLCYVMQENQVVSGYYKNNDYKFYNKYFSAHFDKKKLIKLLNDSINKIFI